MLQFSTSMGWFPVEQSEYPWYFKETKSEKFQVVFTCVRKIQKKVKEKTEFLRKT